MLAFTVRTSMDKTASEDAAEVVLLQELEVFLFPGCSYIHFWAIFLDVTSEKCLKGFSLNLISAVKHEY